MPGRGQPIRDNLLKLIGGHTGMACHDKLNKPFFSGGGKSLDIILQHGLERLLRLPLRMLGRQSLDAVDGEQELKVGGFL